MRDPLVPGPDHFENWADRIGHIEFIEDQKFAEDETVQPRYFYAALFNAERHQATYAVWWL